MFKKMYHGLTADMDGFRRGQTVRSNRAFTNSHAKHSEKNLFQFLWTFSLQYNHRMTSLNSGHRKDHKPHAASHMC